jgi:hypothetical protein
MYPITQTSRRRVGDKAFIISVLACEGSAHLFSLIALLSPILFLGQVSTHISAESVCASQFDGWHQDSDPKLSRPYRHLPVVSLVTDTSLASNFAVGRQPVHQKCHAEIRCAGPKWCKQRSLKTVWTSSTMWPNICPFQSGGSKLICHLMTNAAAAEDSHGWVGWGALYV